ncbi:hypothetical protein BC941DRAFT_510893 [Chlamydoabsidia padenii]|nr:hypothetical protein BC941DRAFT_510893 [Chlamydoabsidia padenii]
MDKLADFARRLPLCRIAIRPSLFAVAGRRRHRVLFHTWICWRMGCAGKAGCLVC